MKKTSISGALGSVIAALGLAVISMHTGCASPLDVSDEETVVDQSGDRLVAPDLPRLGYTHHPSYPGQPCQLHRICRFLCYGPSYPADCDYHCESECVYPFVPKPPLIAPPRDD